MGRLVRSWGDSTIISSISCTSLMLLVVAVCDWTMVNINISRYLIDKYVGRLLTCRMLLLDIRCGSSCSCSIRVLIVVLLLDLMIRCLMI